MNDTYKKFMQISICVSIFIFILFAIFNISKIASFYYSYLYVDLVQLLLSIIGKTLSATTIFMFLFNKWLWKVPPIKLLHDIPILNKKYSGVFISDYDNQQRTAEVMIEQTFLSISIKYKTGESYSNSIVASFVNVHNTKYLVYTYHNVPNADIQDNSPIHYGTTIFNVDNIHVLEGNYFTGRKTKGSIKVEAVE